MEEIDRESHQKDSGLQSWQTGNSGIILRKHLLIIGYFLSLHFKIVIFVFF